MWFVEFGIPVGGVIVNGVIEKNEAQKGIDFVNNRVAMQQEYMKDIDSSFEGMVRGVIPLFESDIRGVDKLDRVASLLF